MIPHYLKPLTSALAAQCFLNEYVYLSSKEEEASIIQLIDLAANKQEAINEHLAIIGCYKAIYKIGIRPELIKNYPMPNESSRELIMAQFKEPFQEEKIKTS